MTRQEFLQELRVALQGEVSQSQVNEHLRYYENYIMEEARKGKTEQQVLEELGSPRLIAKTLIDAGDHFYRDYDESYHTSGYGQEEAPKRGFSADYSGERGWDVRYGRFRLNSWYGKLLLVLLAVAILVFVARLVAFLLPIVVPVILVLMILSFVLGRRR